MQLKSCETEIDYSARPCEDFFCSRKDWSISAAAMASRCFFLFLVVNSAGANFSWAEKVLNRSS